jgi:hypothetical protein
MQRDDGTVFGGAAMTAAVVFVLFATMTVMALDFPPKARAMPLMVGIPGTSLALICLIKALRVRSRETSDWKTEKNRDERQMLVWTVLYFLGILGFGFLYAAPLLVFAFLRFAKREAALAAVVGAVGTWAVLYGLFEVGFQIPLFDGLVITWLLG